MTAGDDPRGFIGRGVELARLEAARTRVETGAGTTVVIGGEAGIGKTRLVEEFARTMTARGSTVLGGSCLPSGGSATPYAPFVEALRGSIRTVEPGRLPALLGPGRRELARLLPDIETGTPAPVATIDPDVHGQARLFEAVLAFLERVSRVESSLVVIDDLQWADDGTLELLPFLLRNTRGSRILFVLLVRTDEPDADGAIRRLLAELDRDAGVERLELGPLDRTDSRALLEARGTTDASGDLLEDLLGRAGGNPFYLEQLAVGSGGERALSPGLREVLAAQWDPLESTCRHASLSIL